MLVAIVSGKIRSPNRSWPSCWTIPAAGPVVIGPTMPDLESAHASAVEAMAGMEAVVGWPGSRPVHSLELLPERALAGDPTAAATLTATLTKPLSDAGAVLTATLEAYLTPGSAESCARTLFVHPNTVRYRPKRITEITGRDPTNPRDAYVLRVATTVSRLTHYRNKT